MFASGIISIVLKLTPIGVYFFGKDAGIFPDYYQYPAVVLITTIIWLIATYITQPESKEVLQKFYKKIQPGGPGWEKVIKEAAAEGIELKDNNERWSVPSGLLAMLLGCVLIYSCMFATGYYIYGDYDYALPLTGVAIVSGFLLIRTWKKIRTDVL
jgi:hypothetical protein